MVSEREGRRPLSIWVLLIGLALLGLGGLHEGIALVLDPSGSSMGVPLSLLDGLPLSDFLLPGLFLLMVMGLAPWRLIVGVWKSWPGAWRAGLALGLVLFG